MKRVLWIFSVICGIFCALGGITEGLLLPPDGDNLQPSLLSPSASLSNPAASVLKGPEPALFTADKSPVPQKVTQEDIEELLRQLIQKQNPGLSPEVLNQKVQEALTSWLSLARGIPLGESYDSIAQGMEYNRDGAIWELNYKAGKFLVFELNATGRDLTQFEKISFYVKGGTSMGKLTGTTYFRIGFTDEQRMLMYDEVARDALAEGITVSSEKMGDWQLVEIDLKKIRDNNPGIAWNNIPGIVVIFDKNELEDLPRGETDKGIMYFKDIVFVPDDKDDQRLLGLNEIATILKTALLGVNYDLGKKRDFNLMRYVKEELKMGTEKEILGQFKRWSESSLAANRLPQALPETEKEFLLNILKGNFEFYNSFGMDEATGLPYDFIVPEPCRHRVPSGKLTIGEYNKVAGIGLALASYAVAVKMGLLSEEEALARIRKVFATLDNVEVYEVPEGAFQGKKYLYEGYEFRIKNEEGKYQALTSGSNHKPISSIDTAWFLAGLVVLKEGFKDVPDIVAKADYWLKNNDLGFFYDEEEHLFNIGYDYFFERGHLAQKEGFYGIFSSETRILSYLGLGLDALSEEEFSRHWQALWRGKRSDFDGEYQDMDLVLSWAGGAFEFGMPTLFVDEMALNPYGQGINLYKAMVAQKLWAEDRGYAVFGESPSADEYYGYGIFGSLPTATPGARLESRGIITPHASFMFPFASAIKNLRTMTVLYPEAFLEEYGFASAVNTNNNETILLYNSLERGMTVLALANMLGDNLIQKMFLSGMAKGEKIKEFLENDKPFFSTFDIAEEITVLYEAGIKHLEKGEWRQANTLFDYVDFLDKTYQLNFDYKDWQEKYTQAKQLAQQDLEILYAQALGAFAQENYAEALKYLREIISFDVDYKEAARLYREVRQK